jgi:hypothetical protein
MTNVDHQNLRHVLDKIFNSTAVIAELYSNLLLGKETPQIREAFTLEIFLGMSLHWRSNTTIERLRVRIIRYISRDLEDIDALRERLAMVYGKESRTHEIILNWAQHGL